MPENIHSDGGILNSNYSPDGLPQYTAEDLRWLETKRAEYPFLVIDNKAFVEERTKKIGEAMKDAKEKAAGSGMRDKMGAIETRDQVVSELLVKCFPDDESIRSDHDLIIFAREIGTNIPLKETSDES